MTKYIFSIIGIRTELDSKTEQDVNNFLQRFMKNPDIDIHSISIKKIESKEKEDLKNE